MLHHRKSEGRAGSDPGPLPLLGKPYLRSDSLAGAPPGGLRTTPVPHLGGPSLLYAKRRAPSNSALILVFTTRSQVYWILFLSTRGREAKI